MINVCHSNSRCSWTRSVISLVKSYVWKLYLLFIKLQVATVYYTSMEGEICQNQIVMTCTKEHSCFGLCTFLLLVSCCYSYHHYCRRHFNSCVVELMRMLWGLVLSSYLLQLMTCSPTMFHWCLLVCALSC